MAIKRCECKSEYQDKRYGRKLRVHNESKTNTGIAYKCTVCGSKK